MIQEKHKISSVPVHQDRQYYKNQRRKLIYNIVIRQVIFLPQTTGQ